MVNMRVIGSFLAFALLVAVAPALADHWQDVCAAFHDAEAHHLYVPPKEIAARLAEAHIQLSSISGDQDISSARRPPNTSC